MNLHRGIHVLHTRCSRRVVYVGWYMYIKFPELIQTFNIFSYSFRTIIAFSTGVLVRVDVVLVAR